MNCKNCNAVMRADHERKVFVCPYCDSIEPFEGVSKDELQGMLHEAIKDVRKQSMQEAKENLKKETTFRDDRTSGQKALDAVSLIFQVFFCLFLAIFALGGLVGDYVGLGIISLLQLILMISAMILKYQSRRKRSAKLWKIKNGLLIGVGALVILWFVAVVNGGKVSTTDIAEKESSWPSQGLGSDLPEPGNGTIRTMYSNKSDFSATLKSIKQADFDAYVEECKKCGYTIDAEATDHQYEAYNETDQKLTVSYWKSSNELNVRVEKAVTMGEFHWPTGEIVQGIPVPDAEKSNLEKLSNHSLSMYVGDLTKEEFVNYVNQCIEDGFEGSYYDDSDTFYGKKEDKSLRLEFQRGRIMYLDVYVSNH